MNKSHELENLNIETLSQVDINELKWNFERRALEEKLRREEWKSFNKSLNEYNHSHCINLKLMHRVNETRTTEKTRRIISNNH